MCCWEAGIVSITVDSASSLAMRARFHIQCHWFDATCHFCFLSFFCSEGLQLFQFSNVGWWRFVKRASRRWKIDIFKQLSIHLLDEIQPLLQSSCDFHRTNIFMCAVFFYIVDFRCAFLFFKWFLIKQMWLCDNIFKYTSSFIYQKKEVMMTKLVQF